MKLRDVEGFYSMHKIMMHSLREHVAPHQISIKKLILIQLKCDYILEVRFFSKIFYSQFNIEIKHILATLLHILEIFKPLIVWNSAIWNWPGGGFGTVVVAATWVLPKCGRHNSCGSSVKPIPSSVVGVCLMLRSALSLQEAWSILFSHGLHWRLSHLHPGLYKCCSRVNVSDCFRLITSTTTPFF